ncbi:MAG: BrnT family toxin [bacterium]
MKRGYKKRMKIEDIIWLRNIVDKLAVKPNVTPNEVEEVLNNKPKFRFVEKGERKGEDVYLALGQTNSGRYLSVLFIYKKTRETLILSARNMKKKERKQYGKK